MSATLNIIFITILVATVVVSSSIQVGKFVSIVTKLAALLN